jgi:hypothetical protein
VWSSLEKIQYTELRLLCGNDHIVKNSNFGVITIIPFDNLYRRAYFVMHTFLVCVVFCKPLSVFLSFVILAIVLSADPKINRVFSLPQGNHVAKFGKDPTYRTRVIVRKRSCCQNSIYSNSDLDL